MSIDNYGQRKSAGQRAALRLNIVPQPKAEKAREPLRPTNTSVKGGYPSTKMKRAIVWESQLEQKACSNFEFSPAVVEFREQPETFYIPTSEGLSRYTPDFELTLYNDDICYVEIKPLYQLYLPPVFDRMQAADRFFAEKGYHFMVLTEEELNFPNRVRNFLILRPYLRFDIPLPLIQQIKEWLGRTNYPTLESLSQFLGSRSTAFALLAQLYIGFDFDQPLENSSQLFPPIFGDHHETCFFAFRTGPDFMQRTVSSDPHP